MDVSFCKCADYTTCRCEKDKKIPIEERDFLTDQINEKRTVIGVVDNKTTKKIQNRNTRKETSPRDLQKEPKSTSNEVCSGNLNEESNTEKNYSDSEEIQTASTSKLCLPLPNFAMACDRYGIPDPVAAAVDSKL